MFTTVTFCVVRKTANAKEYSSSQSNHKSQNIINFNIRGPITRARPAGPHPIYSYINDSRLNPAFPDSPSRARSRGHAACGPTAEQPRTTTRTVDAHTDRSKMGVVRSTRPPSQRLTHSEHEALPARRRGKPESYSSAFNCCSCVLPWLIAAVAHSCRGS